MLACSCNASTRQDRGLAVPIGGRVVPPEEIPLETESATDSLSV